MYPDVFFEHLMSFQITTESHEVAMKLRRPWTARSRYIVPLPPRVPGPKRSRWNLFCRFEVAELALRTFKMACWCWLFGLIRSYMCFVCLLFLVTIYGDILLKQPVQCKNPCDTGADLVPSIDQVLHSVAQWASISQVHPGEKCQIASLRCKWCRKCWNKQSPNKSDIVRHGVTESKRFHWDSYVSWFSNMDCDICEHPQYFHFRHWYSIAIAEWDASVEVKEIQLPERDSAGHEGQTVWTPSTLIKEWRKQMMSSHAEPSFVEDNLVSPEVYHLKISIHLYPQQERLPWTLPLPCESRSLCCWHELPSRPREFVQSMLNRGIHRHVEKYGYLGNMKQDEVTWSHMKSHEVVHYNPHESTGISWHCLTKPRLCEWLSLGSWHGLWVSDTSYGLQICRLVWGAMQIVTFASWSVKLDFTLLWHLDTSGWWLMVQYLDLTTLVAGFLPRNRSEQTENDKGTWGQWIIMRYPAVYAVGFFEQLKLYRVFWAIIVPYNIQTEYIESSVE